MKTTASNPALNNVEIRGADLPKIGFDSVDDPTPWALKMPIDRRLKMEKALLAAAGKEYRRLQFHRPMFCLAQLRLKYRIARLDFLLFALRLRVKFSNYLFHNDSLIKPNVVSPPHMTGQMPS